MKKARLLIAVGTTGGHLYPALSVAKEAKEKAEIYFSGIGKGMSEKIVNEEGYAYLEIASLPWAGKKLSEKIGSLLVLFRGVYFCARKIQGIKPNAVFGTGSFATVPVMLSCIILSVPIYIFEADTKPGMTTRLFCRFSKKVFLAFSETSKYLPATVRTVHTGTPVRKEIGKVKRKEALEKFNLSPDRKVILVFGGSQGSQTLEKTFYDMYKNFGIPGEAQLLASSGKFSIGLFEKCGEKPIVFRYIDDMASAYACADVVLSRSGAMTVAELSASGTPSVLVPLKLARGHQIDNALQLEKKGIAVIIDEERLNAKTLYDSIEKAFEKNYSELKPRENISHIRCDPARLISEEIINEI
ncbi:UDP-N-acetylglucosamine--N-acetylmuramyl-(pentapeptide) pyrophosphoryl-undecaprenol N-acetylglucosamine transferase [candidate division WOR-3 bacterium]|nr:UDP-N-acetylglucosamine--N-acetylmuramyl-(pentapeptide) pyrophosphoryl-undecaprenol N-acetylglucosamine transferase [candidate division WOR-3 bacterium]